MSSPSRWPAACAKLLLRGTATRVAYTLDIAQHRQQPNEGHSTRVCAMGLPSGIRNRERWAGAEMGLRLLERRGPGMPMMQARRQATSSLRIPPPHTGNMRTQLGRGARERRSQRSGHAEMPSGRCHRKGVVAPPDGARWWRPSCWRRRPLRPRLPPSPRR
jgi:hypothetical protein